MKIKKRSQVVESTKYIPKIDYSNESVDIALKCRNYLLENDFFNNNRSTNLELLEKAIIDYSFWKVSSWQQRLNRNEEIHCDTLKQVVSTLNSYITDEKEREFFFAQYCHSIVYFLGAINRQNQIELKKAKDKDEQINFITDGEKIDSIIIDFNLPNHELMVQLFDKADKFFNGQKVKAIQK